MFDIFMIRYEDMRYERTKCLALQTFLNLKGDRREIWEKYDSDTKLNCVILSRCYGAAIVAGHPEDELLKLSLAVSHSTVLWISDSTFSSFIRSLMSSLFSFLPPSLSLFVPHLILPLLFLCILQMQGFMLSRRSTRK